MSRLLNKKSILQILPSLISGGVEGEVIQLSKLVKDNGFGSYVASAGGGLVSRLMQNDIQHIKIPLDRKNLFSMLMNIFRLKKIIKQYQIDIIHVHSRAPAWCVYFAVKWTNCKVITTIHGAYNISCALKRKYNSIMLRSNKIIAVSNFIKNYLISNYNVNSDQVEVVYCGIDLNSFNFQNVDKGRVVRLAEQINIATNKPIILVPGRIVQTKGFETVINAFKLLPRDFATCLFVGKEKPKSNYRKKLQQMINDNNLKDNIFICKPISDMSALYVLADIVISASHKAEALGLVALEAEAMEKLVIATNIGGSNETIIDKETGILVNPDSPKELKDAIEYCLSLNENERSNIVKKARKHIENCFSLSIKNHKMLKIYQEVVTKNE